MRKAIFPILAAVVAFTGTAQAALAVECRKPEEKSILRKIESRKDAILFDYYPNELSDNFTVEYLNCRTGAAVSVNVGNRKWKSGQARKVFRTAIESSVKYTGTEVIKALSEKDMKGSPGKLDNTICGCWDKVLRKSSSKWGKY